jgi:uncharacterized GH25 family protein
MSARFLLVVAVTWLSLTGTAGAHDFWLYPEAHRQAAPGGGEIRIFLGQENDVTELERRPAHFIRFEAHGAAGVVPTTGKSGPTSPAGRVELPAEDIYSIIYESRHGYVELPAEKFQHYLAEEGLTDILEERTRRNETAQPGSEAFARYAKALVKVGAATTGYDRKVGMPAELVATVDPFRGGDDGFLEFQLWYLGKPRAGASIELFTIGELSVKSVETAVSDADGRVRFANPGVGRWMVAGTVARRAAPPIEAHWESFWTSITFEVETVERERPASTRWGSKLVFVGVLAVLAVVFLVRQRRRAR